MLREEIRSIHADKRQLRSFGITLGIALIIIAGVLFWRDSGGSLIVTCVGVVFLIIGLVVPKWLRPLYKPWMTLALVLGFVMTRVLLTGIYILLFIPTGLLMRIFRRDPLHRKLDPDASTYWIPKKYDVDDASERLKRYY
ncbi:MAG: SxtJ family membrane protein [Bacteroidetes bacterium]|nr:SxtJ family membrane protein [Bacteroidota bacterium]